MGSARRCVAFLVLVAACDLPEPPQPWTCVGAGSLIAVEEEDRVDLTFADGETLTLPRVASSRGAKYARPGNSWQRTGDISAVLTRDGRTVTCNAIRQRQ